MSDLPILDEFFDKQLINCLNLQTNLRQNLSQYSRHISFQLTEIRNNVETLANRLITLQQQRSQFFSPLQTCLPPLPSTFFQPTFPSSSPLHGSSLTNTSESTTEQLSFAFSSRINEQSSRSVPFVFNPIRPNDITYSNNKNQFENDTDESSIKFQPIEHLSTMKMNEENEDVLFCEFAELYRFDALTNEMKEHDRGEMKILQHKTTKCCRILMQHKQIFKVCPNHPITSQIELKEHQENENTYVWSIMNMSDGEPKHETLHIKFKKNEHGTKFAKIFDQAKDINEKEIEDRLTSMANISLNDNDIIIIGEVKPTREQIERAKQFQLPSTFYLYENKEPCKGCRGCREDSPLFQLNETHIRSQENSYDNATPTLFEDLPNFPSDFFPNSPYSALMSLVSRFSTDMNSFSVSPPQKERIIIKAKRCLPTNRLPPPSSFISLESDHRKTSLQINEADETMASQTHQKKTRNISSANSDLYLLSNYASKIAQNIIDQIKQELYKLIVNQQSIIIDHNATSTLDNDYQSSDQNMNSAQSIFENISRFSDDNHSTIDSIVNSLTSSKPLNHSFSFSTFADTITPLTDFKFSTSSSSSAATATSTISSHSPIFPFESIENKILFGNISKVSFSDLAQQAFDFQSTIDDNEPRVFPGQGTPIFTDDEIKIETNNESKDDSYEPVLTFKPIVHLLPVETKTGEEDENILFCEHAELYRFDSLTNEMKERGIGKMKILQHKTTKFCRILMRRDKIFKVCANHRITSQMELNEDQEQENAFLWSAMDMSDGEVKHETLCVKFKNHDQAKRFFEQFNEAKKINLNIQ